MTEAIKVIGIGDDGKQSLLPLYRRWIEESQVLVGGKRHLAFFPDYQGEKVEISGGLKDLARRLKEETRPTVVLASGDPLFYGIGGYLAKQMPVEVYPSLSSLQLAFARMGESWQDAYIHSVHGRPMTGLAQRIDGRDKVVLLTDVNNSPQAIAAYLIKFGMTEYKAFVAENLGGEDERTGWYTLDEMVELHFSPLNVVVLKRVGPSPQWPLGIDDEAFAQRKPDKGLITKKEVRVLSLAQLGLRTDSVVWDIGTCTGSVAIEAARLAREGAVYAIEKNEADLELCRRNMLIFRTDLVLKHGKAPDGLEDFPDPDAIFIGGTGGNLEALLNTCASRLKPHGTMVLNAATIETLSQALAAFKALGFATQVTQVQVSRSKPILNMNRFLALNPVFILRASRERSDQT
ncbi:precorrin-6Y C5,15-methyltransferase (decarboxylating) [Caldalkalibacillus uzonensis]|uniref:Precorrin-6Y C5,15-methyltransferase (Decarboxylating) n=1 Tax=Caldalkalibacillus uzonensis TaxID=353224 RepID=A0ABU0CR94_9BACI|nr:precorrin-6y C5,15-methyltransferase (decarboxylating) subunit CbiE [Caldalkalibacillus uzonensis]MDQ0338389.1 precorrin-6Y C5,15-methyltransferase (decarboxylating) [Caldalkalibacillus uzonensis]